MRGSSPRMTPKNAGRAFHPSACVPGAAQQNWHVPVIHGFTCQTARLRLRFGAASQRSAARILYRRRVRRSPPSLPPQMRGDGAPGGATIVFLTAFPLENAGASRRATQTSLRSLGLFAGVLLTAPGRAFRRPSDLVDGRRQPSSWQAARIGRRAEPRRRPSACLASGTPAGAASCSITKTPLDDALA